MDGTSASQQRLESQRNFDEALRRAFVEDLVNVLLRRERNPLSYDELRRGLPDYAEVPRGTQMIPLKKIVGSVGRYRDFTRSFMPRNQGLSERWKRLDVALNQLESWPPIDVYQVGDRYFVSDGNHRVSVARANDLPEIEANVTEVQTPMHLDLDRPVIPQLLEYERARFVRETNIEKLCGSVDIRLTELGGYSVLLEHIQVHRWYMGEHQARPIPMNEAVENWCHDIYRPLVRLIDRKGLLDAFPTRTPGDLYIWLTRHLHEVRKLYGDHYSAETVADALRAQVSEPPIIRFFHELARATRQLITPIPYEPPEPLP